MTQSSNPNNTSDKKFLVYTSSAGSGKTYTLSRFFIKLLLKTNNPSYFKHIAALTFTNKAANEMKERIFSNLLLLSLASFESEEQKKDAQKLMNDYVYFLQISREEIQDKSEKIVNEILHNYSDLTVQTIDKFTHKIVRPFSRDLDISPDFSIELNEDDIIKKSVELMLQKSSDDELLSKLLLDFAYFKVDEGKRFQSFEDDLLKLANVFKKEEAIEFLKDYKENTLQFFFHKKDEIRQQLLAVKKKMNDAAISAVLLINEAGLSWKDFAYAGSGVGMFFQKIANEDYTANVGKRVLDALLDDAWYSKNSIRASEIDAISPKLKEYLSVIVNEFPNYYNYSFLYKRIFPTALLNEVEKIIDDVKDSQNILTISDFNKLISNLIATSHLSVPFLYERIGERYNHYLLDEFQDTSVLQWNNMLPLIDDSLSKGNENLLVGDAKQAIYRFRNGDVEQFVSLPNLPHKPNKNYELFEKTLERNIQKETLQTNYRSYSNIIEFNNLLFSELTKNLNDYQKEIYKDVAQKTTSKEGGYVNVQFYEGGEFSDEALNFTLNSIYKSLEAGFKPNEIALLVRNRKEISKLAELLVQNNIEVVSEESLKLTYSEDVKKIIECFKFIVNPNDSLQTTQLLFLLEPEIESKKVYDLLSSKKIQSYVDEKFCVNQKLLQHSTLTAIDKLSNLLSLNINSAYFVQFKSFVWDRFKKEGVSISDFIRYWKTLEEKDSIPSLKNSEVSSAVQILTIHKSKGLQYPVVIMPFVDWKTNFKDAIKWIEPVGVEGLSHLAVNISPNSLENTDYTEVSKLESDEAFLESLNLLYVALTRAEEQLYVFSDAKKGIGNFIFENIKHNLILSNQTIEIGTANRLSEIKDKDKEDLSKIELKNSFKESKSILNVAVESSKYWNEENVSVFDYGNYFHDIMKKLKTTKDKEKIISSLKNDSNLSSEDSEKLVSDIEQLLQDETMKNVFRDDNLVFNEKEIFFENDKLRIDKLSLTNDGKIFLVDFKTGEEKSSDIKQIKNYQKALEKLNFNNIESILYYTKFNKVVTV